MIWIDKSVDIAIIKIAAQNLITLSLGDSNDLCLGNEVYMISNPVGYGFNQQLQDGIISEINKTFKIVNEDMSLQYIEDIMKINSRIENSQTGSPILNSKGELLGISSSKFNFVVPINRIKNIIERLEKENKFDEAYIGIHGYDNDIIKYLNLGLNVTGVYIEYIEENSPVKDKVFSGDIIKCIDNIKIYRMQDLINYIYTKNPDDIIKLDIIRGTETINLEIRLQGVEQSRNP